MKKLLTSLLSCALLFPVNIMAAEPVQVQSSDVPAVKSLQDLETIQVKGTTLRKGTDYDTSVQLTNNKQTAQVLFTFKNNYSGQVVKAYTLGSCDPFADATNDWSKSYIAYAYDLGLMKGYSEDGLFHPYDAVSRGMVATILYRLARADETSTVSPFADINGYDTATYFAKPAIWAYRNGVVNGYTESDGSKTFRGAEAISREQLAALLYRFAGEPAKEITRDLGSFVDGAQVNPDFQKAMAWCASKGVFSGNPTQAGMALKPQDPATREELAKILSVYYRL